QPAGERFRHVLRDRVLDVRFRCARAARTIPAPNDRSPGLSGMVRTAFRKFRDANVKLSWITTPSQLWETRGFAIYEWVARALLGRPGANVILDVGGGRTWHFGDDYWRNPDFKLIGVDVDPAE